MLELDQLVDVLASVSRDRILPLFAPDEQLNANQVCRRLGLTISKVKRVRAALRRFARAGDLLECVSASFPGLRKSSPTYTVQCVPETPTRHRHQRRCPGRRKGARTISTALDSATTPPAPPPDPHTPTTPSNPCCVCRTTPSLVVLLPCRHQRVCSPCWDEYERREKQQHKSELRRYPHRERSRLVVLCPICREAVVETLIPF